MRQFLGTLISLLQNSGQTEKKVISQHALSRVLRNLRPESSQGTVKSSLYSLGLIISKELTPLKDILDAFQDNLQPGNPSTRTSNRIEKVKFVFCVLFDWAQYSELASVAGQASCTFSRQLRKDFLSEQDGASNIDISSLWMEPLLQCLRRYPDALQNIQLYVFPELFAMNVPDYYKFLCTMGLHAHISNDVVVEDVQLASSKEANSSILFTALQVGKETGLVLDSGRFGFLLT